MKQFFSPNDFFCYTRIRSAIHGQFSNMKDHELMAYIANNEFNKALEQWPVVYGCYEDGKVIRPFGILKCVSDTHTARLAYISEIKEEPCKHLAANYRGTFPPQEAVCSECGKRMLPKITWVEAE